MASISADLFPVYDTNFSQMTSNLYLIAKNMGKIQKPLFSCHYHRTLHKDVGLLNAVQRTGIEMFPATFVTLLHPPARLGDVGPVPLGRLGLRWNVEEFAEALGLYRVVVSSVFLAVSQEVVNQIQRQ